MASGGRRKSASTRHSFGSQRSSSSIQKSEVYINVYDLLPVITQRQTPRIGSTLTIPAREIVLPPLVPRVVAPSHRRRHKVPEPRICIRRSQLPRSLRCLQHPARSRASRRDVSLLPPPRFHPPHAERNPYRHPRNSARVPWPELQPSDQQLQPLLELLVPEVDRKGAAELDEQSCHDRDRLAVYRAHGVG